MTAEPVAEVDSAAPGPEDAASRPVCLAFQLGWDMSTLYRQGRPRQAPAKFVIDEKAKGRTRYPKLPAQGDFDRVQRTERRLTAVTVGLVRLNEGFEQAGIQRPSVDGVRAAYEGTDSDALKEEIYDLHMRTLLDLQAADPRLGSAYNLGRGLAATRAGAFKDLHGQFDSHRIGGLCDELDDLISFLPPHAGRAVMWSLRWWERALTPRLKGEKWIDRQAERWRALLSGEKHGPDMLRPEDYTEAANRLLERAASLAGRVLKTHWRPLALGAALLIAGVGIGLWIGGVGGTVAAVAAVAGAFGISWKTVASTATGLADRLRKPLWGAELDLAIARAITEPRVRNAYDRLPEGKRDPKVPPATASGFGRG